MSPPELIVIRHGRTEWNERGRWQGHADPPLSAAGRRQAEELAQRLAGTPIDRIESSDLLRARETAAPLARSLGLPVHTDPAYRELDVGEWSGRTRDQIAALDAALLRTFREGDPDAAAPGGESRRELWRRAHAAIASLCDRCPGGRVALVTHGGFVRACFPAVEVDNVSVHRGSGGAILERLARGPGA